MHETAGHRARSGVHVLVVAPDGEVGAGIMQAQRQVAGSVGMVEADHRAGGVAQAHDLRHVERLPGAILHARPQHQRQARAVLGDGLLDRGHREGAVGLIRLHFDQIGVRVEAVEAHLRLQRIAVGGKRPGLHQDRRPLRRGPVEADHHQMQVGGERVHRHHLRGQGAHGGGQAVTHQRVVGHPLAGPGEVSFHRLDRPFLQHFLHVAARRLGLQAQRVAAEIRLLAPVVPGNMEFTAQGLQRIGCIQRAGVIVVEKLAHGVDSGWPGSRMALV